MKDFSTAAFNTLVRMMAEERFTIIHGNFDTASIDLYARLIKLPMWSEETHEVAMLLRMHECAHGLFTPPKGYHRQNFMYDDQHPGFSSYLNIMEDARIDRLMKRKFKGYAWIYDAGYRQLFNRGFFGTTDKDAINSRGLADRINIKAKTRFDWVEMKNPEESALYLQVIGAETFQDTIAATHAVYEYAKKTKMKKISSQFVLDAKKAINDLEELCNDNATHPDEIISLQEDGEELEPPVDEPISDIIYRKSLETNEKSYNTVVRSKIIDTSVAVKYNVHGYKDIMKLGDLLTGIDMDEIVGRYNQSEEDFMEELD